MMDRAQPRHSMAPLHRPGQGRALSKTRPGAPSLQAVSDGTSVKVREVCRMKSETCGGGTRGHNARPSCFYRASNRRHDTGERLVFAQKKQCAFTNSVKPDAP